LKKEHAHEQKKTVKREAKKFDDYLEDAEKEHANEEDKAKAKNQKAVLERVKEQAASATADAKFAISKVTATQEKLATARARNDSARHEHEAITRER
jgi:hypothetical protein